MLPNFRSMPGAFSQAYRGTSRESNAAGGEKAGIDALMRVCIHALGRCHANYLGANYGMYFN